MEYTKRLLVLEGLLSTLPDCQGWMIAKCRISLGNRKMKTSDQFPLQILKKDGRLAKIHICSFAGEEKDLLDVTLINPGQKMALGSRETDRYLREVKDQNPIHQGEGAIVPGFLMANKILKQLSPQIPFQAEFRFLTPLQIERSGWLEFLSSDEENDPKIEAEKALKKVQKIHLRTPQNIILKAEITEYKE